MKQNKIKQSDVREIKRSEIHLAAYNPRKISEKARKKLKANLKKVGLLGGIVWNETTGNLVSGHQRVSVMDEVNRYDGSEKTDYALRVEVVQLDEKQEREQNLFMNNRGTQGVFDEDMLTDMLADIDFEEAGFDDFDLQMLGLESVDEDLKENKFYGESRQWDKKKFIGGSAELQKRDEESMAAGEARGLSREKNFYEDTAENQLARHNDVQKIKDRIAGKSDFNNDGGMLSYVVISFSSPTAKMNFLQDYGYPYDQTYIEAQDFQNRLEFGIDEENM